MIIRHGRREAMAMVMNHTKGGKVAPVGDRLHPSSGQTLTPAAYNPHIAMARPVVSAAAMLSFWGPKGLRWKACSCHGFSVSETIA